MSYLIVRIHYRSTVEAIVREVGLGFLAAPISTADMTLELSCKCIVFENGQTSQCFAYIAKL
jgi:hypothetical protein